ncbi:MAG: TetR/AcrR family transcriptional regulator [Ostreibacterium sp.]
MQKMSHHSGNAKQKKRKAIIRTAIKLFVKYGLHDVSIKVLAQKAGIATGSIYNYFDNKDDLINTAFQGIITESLDFLREGYDQTQSIQARFHYLFKRKISYCLKYPEKFQFLSLCAYSPIVMGKQAKICDDSPLAAVIEDGQAQQLIKDLPKEDIFYYAFGGMDSLLEWKLFNQQEISEADINTIVGMTWDAIKCK